jgi:hypothetical protein
MDKLNLFILAHVILVPYSILVIADDIDHPERWANGVNAYGWSTFYRNPYISIPFCVVVEALVVGRFFYCRSREQREEEGLRLLTEANRLLAGGFEAEADAAYREGCRLCKLQR